MEHSFLVKKLKHKDDGDVTTTLTQFNSRMSQTKAESEERSVLTIIYLHILHAK